MRPATVAETHGQASVLQGIDLDTYLQKQAHWHEVQWREDVVWRDDVVNQALKQAS